MRHEPRVVLCRIQRMPSRTETLEGWGNRLTANGKDYKSTEMGAQIANLSPAGLAPDQGMPTR